MTVNVVLLAISLLAQGVIGLTIVGSAYAWPEEKLDSKHLNFLIGCWFILLGSTLLSIQTGAGVIKVNLPLGIGYLIAIVLEGIALNVKTDKRQWSLTGYALLVFAISLGLSVI